MYDSKTMEKETKARRTDIIKDMTANALIAALYAAFTIAIAPISYGPIQFRFSEILVLLCFFNKKYMIGLTLGCLLANLYSPTASLDIPFGTAATLVACVGIMFSKHLAVAAIFPVVCNAFVVGGELYLFGSPFWYNVLWVGVGELVVMIAAYVIFMLLKRNESFYKLINATQNTEFKF